VWVARGNKLPGGVTYKKRTLEEEASYDPAFDESPIILTQGPRKKGGKVPRRKN